MTILPTKCKKGHNREKERNVPPASNGTTEWNRTNNVVIRKPKKQTPEVSKSPSLNPKKSSSANRSRSRSPGVNSDDERDIGFRNDQLEMEFEQRLRDVKGYQIKRMSGDGACLFRAVADQVYGDQEMHAEVRRLCMDYMEKNRDHFVPFITEQFDDYVARKRLPDTHGNHMELQAISELYARPVELFEYNEVPRNLFQTPTNEMNAPLRLSYHGNVHYNSVVDPFNATIGVGLGLPGLVPGAADAQLVSDALRQSETIHLEETMLHDKMHMTDWQRTEEDLKEQVARESYLEYVRKVDGDVGKSENPSCSSKVDHLSSADEPCSSKQSNLYEELLSMQTLEWNETEENDLLTHAMLLSQQQLLEDCNRKRNMNSSDGPSSSKS